MVSLETQVDIFKGNVRERIKLLWGDRKRNRKSTTIDVSLLLIIPAFYLTNFLGFAKFLSRRATSNSLLS